MLYGAIWWCSLEFRDKNSNAPSQVFQKVQKVPPGSSNNDNAIVFFVLLKKYIVSWLELRILYFKKYS